MKIDRNGKVNTALITALMMLILMVSAVYFIAHETAHECEGEECPICEALNYFENILYKSDAGCAATVTMAAFFFRPEDTVIRSFDVLCGETPVTQKVRMDS